jgi:hypothetical protein
VKVISPASALRPGEGAVVPVIRHGLWRRRAPGRLTARTTRRAGLAVLCTRMVNLDSARRALNRAKGSRERRRAGPAHSAKPVIAPASGNSVGPRARRCCSSSTWEDGSGRESRNLACGTCRNCVAGWTSACLRANPSGQPGAGYGYPQMGPYWGGQAEYLRVPWADFTVLELPQGTEHERDFTLLPDVFPTGYHGTELAGVEPGRTVAVFGAGPVGLMAAHSANIRGAAQTFVVDFSPTVSC